MVGMERQGWKVQGTFLLVTFLLHRTFLHLGSLTNPTTITARALEAMDVLSHRPPRPRPAIPPPQSAAAVGLRPKSLYQYDQQHPTTTTSTSTSTSTGNGISIRIPKQYEYLLNVPFYIYEEYGVPSSSLQSSLTINGKSIDITTLDPEYPIHSVNEIKSKHADDLYLIAAAMIHPMRTYDPSKAKLFLVPTPFNMLVESMDSQQQRKDDEDDTTTNTTTTTNKLCWNYHPPPNTTTTTTTTTNDNNNNNNNSSIVKQHQQQQQRRYSSYCNQEFVKYVDTGLANSIWYQKNNGKDHIVIMSHWRWWTFKPSRFVNKWKPKHINKCNRIDFEMKLGKRLRRMNRITFPSYYVGKKCPTPPPTTTTNNNNNVVASSSSQLLLPPPKKTHDFSMVATLKPIGRPGIVFQDRINVCNWTQQEQQNESESSSFTMNGCGLGIQCPILSQSRFVIHAMGDTEGSNRPMDAILSHTIPIFTREEQYDVLPTWIDWDLISYFADVSNQTTFINDLKHIANDTKTYQEKQQNLISNTDLFDYDTIVPLDTYMYMFQIELFPDTYNENRTSPYTALLLHDDGGQEESEER